jgi:NADH dehydrogenase
MAEPLVTVFGGTGFLGRRVVAKLLDAGFGVRIAARDPEAVALAEIPNQQRIQRVSADIRDAQRVSAAIEGARAVVNTVSLYAEKGELSFEAIHVEGAERVARCCRNGGVDSLVHISGIGADPESPSRLIRLKALGERAVNEQFKAATIFRPSVMFGRNDAFLRGIEQATRAPIVPLFGWGEIRMQPAYVQDVALAAVRAISSEEARGQVFELGGAIVLTYREAVEAVCAELGRKRLLLPFPLELWRILVGAMQVLPAPPLTVDQLYLLAKDNTVASGSRTFAELAIEPRSVLELLQYCLAPEH